MKKLNMRKFLKELITVIAIVAVVSVVMSAIRAPKLSSETLPNFANYTTIDGKPIELNNNRGTIVYIWATWCKMCQLQSSAIEEMTQNYNVVTIASNSGNNQALQQYVEKKGLSFTVINGSGTPLLKQFQVTAYPTIFMYDKKGILRFTEVGYTTSIGLKSRMMLIE
jgi:thioredoxin-related protein